MNRIRFVVFIGKLYQEFKSGTLTNPNGEFFLIDFKVGYPQINL